MTVHELIEELKKIPPDTEVWLTYEDIIAPVLMVHNQAGMAIIT